MKKILTSISFFAPVLVFAQGNKAKLGNVESFVKDIGDIIDVAIPIVFALALLFFLWGLAKYIFAAGNEEAKDAGKRIMIWGIIALFVMASVWGIVAFLQDVFGVTGNTVDVPDIPGGGSGIGIDIDLDI